MNNESKYIILKIIPVTFVTPLIILMTFLAQTVLCKNINDVVYINLLSYILILISSFAVAIFSEFLPVNKSRFRDEVSFSFFYLLLNSIICFFSGNINLIYFLNVFIILEFVLELIIYKMFDFYQNFVSKWEGLSGSELEKYLYHNNVEAQDLAVETNKTVCLVYITGFFYFILLALSGINHVHFPILIYVNTFIFFVSGFSLLLLTKIFSNKSYFAYLGFNELITSKKKYLGTITGIFLSALIIGFVFSSNHAFIKINQKSEQIKVSTQVIPIEEENVMPFNFEIGKSFNLLNTKKGNYKVEKIVQFIFKVIKYLLICAVIIFFTVYLFGPVVNRKFIEFWQDNKIKKFFSKILFSIKDFFNWIFSKSKKEDYDKIKSTLFKDSMNDFLKKSKKSKEKIKELDRLTVQFMKVIDWGEKNKIKYKNTLAPAEYTELIFNQFDEETGNLARTVGLLFEKALYDKELLTKSEEDVYNNSVKMLTGVKK